MLFIQVHKYISIRYGVKHGLTFALPIHYGRITISPKILPPEYHGAPDGRYHMVVSHTQFSKEGAEKASPSFNSFATSYTNFLYPLQIEAINAR